MTTLADIRNAKYNAFGTIDLEYNHPVFGWIPFTASPTDTNPLSVELYNLALTGTVAPYTPPGTIAYQIAKTTPWKRMTDDEADQIYAAMQLTTPRLRGIYDAAIYLSSDDSLWSVLHDLIASVVGASRADELLAPES